MNQKIQKQTFSKFLRLIFIGMGLSLFLLLGASLMQPATPVRAELPPRPTAVPSNVVNGAQIKLVVAEVTGGEWTTIQWQNPNTKQWITVDGWQGTLETNGIQIWWVGSEQFGRGPFRWLLFVEKDGNLLDTSAEFTMPTHNQEIVTVNIPAVEE